MMMHARIDRLCMMSTKDFDCPWLPPVPFGAFCWPGSSQSSVELSAEIASGDFVGAAGFLSHLRRSHLIARFRHLLTMVQLA